MPWHSVSRTNLEPIDNWLSSLQLVRKTVPKDSSCLFRAAAEQLCLSQSHHAQLRDLALDYMLLYKAYFSNLLSEPLDYHIKKMRSPLEWGTQLEIIALALIFRTDFIIFKEAGARPVNVTNFNFPKKIMLSVDPPYHYDIVYKRNRFQVAGFCQALVYEMLYERVFKMKDVRNIVDQMLHDTNSCFRKDSVNSEGQEIEIIKIVQQVMDPIKGKESSLNTSNDCSDSMSEKGLTPPFPYRVAKALDPDIYRNSEYDAWIALKREARFGPYDSRGLQIGVKVCIKTSKLTRVSNANGKYKEELHGYIQSLTENQGPVEVFVEELGRRITVPYHSLEKCQSTPPPFSHQDSLGLIGGSPPRYKILTTITKKPQLPIPEQYNHCGTGRRRRRTSSAPVLPSPLPMDRRRMKSESMSEFEAASDRDCRNKRDSAIVDCPTPTLEDFTETAGNEFVGENYSCYYTYSPPFPYTEAAKSDNIDEVTETPQMEATQEVFGYPVVDLRYCLPCYVYPPSGSAGVEPPNHFQTGYLSCSPEACAYPIENYYCHAGITPLVGAVPGNEYYYHPEMGLYTCLAPQHITMEGTPQQF